MTPAIPAGVRLFEDALLAALRFRGARQGRALAGPWFEASALRRGAAVAVRASAPPPPPARPALSTGARWARGAAGAARRGASAECRRAARRGTTAAAQLFASLPSIVDRCSVEKLLQTSVGDGSSARAQETLQSEASRKIDKVEAERRATGHTNGL